MHHVVAVNRSLTLVSLDDVMLATQDGVKPPTFVGCVGSECHVDRDHRAVGVEVNPRARAPGIPADVGIDRKGAGVCAL
eukprot:5805031-Prymnesium_polylepis.1